MLPSVMLRKAYIHMSVLFIWWLWLGDPSLVFQFMMFLFMSLVILYFVYEEIRDIRKKEK